MNPIEQAKQQRPQSALRATSDPLNDRAPVAPERPGKLLRLSSVEERTAQKRSSIYAGVKSGNFPPPVRLSARAVAWRSEDVDRWIAERTTARPQT